MPHAYVVYQPDDSGRPNSIILFMIMLWPTARRCAFDPQVVARLVRRGGELPCVTAEMLIAVPCSEALR